MPRRDVIALLFALAISATVWQMPGIGQNAAPATAPNVEWRAYGAVEGSTRYSPIDQINRDNVRNLQVAWT